MKTFDWRTGQIVTEVEFEDFQSAIDDSVKNLTGEYFTSGFVAFPDVTENSPTPDFTVNIVPPAGGAIGRDGNNERIEFSTTQNVDLAALGITLPPASYQKYVTLLIGYAKEESDLRNDPVTTLPYYYVLDDGIEITAVQGIADFLATKPIIPTDGRLYLADILLTDTSTTVTNSMISQERFKRSTTESTPVVTLGKDSFYLDGVNQLTNAVVLSYGVPQDMVIWGMHIDVSDPRTAGTIDMVLKKNGVTVVDLSYQQVVLQINGTNTASDRAEGVDVVARAGDILTIEVTTTGFAPLSNVCDFYLLIK